MRDERDVNLAPRKFGSWEEDWFEMECPPGVTVAQATLENVVAQLRLVDDWSKLEPWEVADVVLANAGVGLSAASLPEYTALRNFAIQQWEGNLKARDLRKQQADAVRALELQTESGEPPPPHRREAPPRSFTVVSSQPDPDAWYLRLS